MRKQITLYDDQFKFYETFNSTNLLVAFVEYMFKDKEPDNLNETEQVLFDSLRMRMDNQKKKSDAWSKSHWWWAIEWNQNAKKTSKTTTEQQQNDNKTTTHKKSKQQQNNNKTTTKQQQDKVEDKDKEEDNIINNNNNLSVVSEQSSPEYWNPEVNECLEIIKSFNNWIINGSEKKGRQYSSNLIKKLKNIDTVKTWKITRQDVLKMTLATAKENEFHSTKTTSPELIYYNLSTLLDVCRNEFKKQQGSQTLHAL